MSHMVKTLARSIREYKKSAILTPLLVTVEVILECIIPFIIANLVNQMQAGCGMDVIVNYGIQLVVMAVLSLIFGVAAGNTCATASTGFARNLRKDMFYHIQDYSFENIDKFSVSIDADLFVRHGLCHGWAPGYDFSCHYPAAEHWTGVGHPCGYPDFSPGIPQIRRAKRFRAGERAGDACSEELCARRVREKEIYRCGR